jgi:Ca2+-binding RTX toxin-like protein
VAWSDFSQSGGDTSGAAVRGQIFAADGGKVGREFLVTTSSFSWLYEPTITGLADGRFVVAWADVILSGGDTSGAAVRGQIFDGRTEAIQLTGSSHADDFAGTRFDDRIEGSHGRDHLDGRAGNDRLRGDKGQDALCGGDGNDRLRGRHGDDRLSGGAGRDLLIGGDGNDSFAYLTAAEAGLEGRRDEITDFLSRADTIDLAAIDADSTVAGNQAFSFIGNAPFSAAGQLSYVQATGLLAGEINGDGITDFQIALSNKPVLLASDILL